MVQDLEHILTAFSKISLREMNAVALLDRTDTKFVIPEHQLSQLLMELAANYKVLHMHKKSVLGYTSLYYDTPEYRFYNEHHNGKIKRTKVRIRRYDDAGVLFLEVKQKDGRGNTHKTRKPIANFETVLSSNSSAFIKEVTGVVHDLQPAIWSSFHRITLVHKEKAERATMDLKLKYSLEDTEKDVEGVVIIEVKQPRLDRNSDLIKLLRLNSITPYKISKYCIGMLKIHSNLKYNLFKEKQLKLANIKSA